MSKKEYAHQCRYCDYCVFTIEDNYWCDEKNEYIDAPKRTNSCKDFLFNEIPADDTSGNKTYKPRKKRNATHATHATQLLLFDIPTDRKRLKHSPYND